MEAKHYNNDNTDWTKKETEVGTYDDDIVTFNVTEYEKLFMKGKNFSIEDRILVAEMMTLIMHDIYTTYLPIAKTLKEEGMGWIKLFQKHSSQEKLEGTIKERFKEYATAVLMYSLLRNDEIKERDLKNPPC